MGYVWAAFLLCLPLCWLAGFAVGRRPRGGLDRRRGGYMRLAPHVSELGNPGTVRRVATFTGCKKAGPWQEALDRQARLAALSRTTAPFVSTSGPYVTSGMATRHGTPTTGADLAGVDCGDAA